MSDLNKPGNLGLDFLNEQQRFRRPPQHQSKNVPTQPNKVPRSTPVIPVSHQPRPQHVATHAAVTFNRAQPLAQQSSSPNNAQPTRTFVAQQPQAIAQQPSISSHVSNTQNDPIKKRWFKSKKVLFIIASLTVLGLLAGTYMLLRPHTTETANKNITRKVDYIKQPPASNTIAANISDAPVSSEDVKNYEVAADMPRTMTIDKLTVYARVMPIGITYAGSIQTPDNIHDVGWYTGSNKPSNKGVMLIVGHLSGTRLPGVFALLNTINDGELIKIQRGDKQVLTYKIVKKESVKAENITMEQLVQPINKNKAGLNLLTSTDGQKTASGEPVNNLIVYAEQV